MWPVAKLVMASRGLKPWISQQRVQYHNHYTETKHNPTPS